jgi:hypothetical protein
MLGGERRKDHESQAIKQQELSMYSLITLLLGLALFGLFFAMVAACDHL